MSEWKKCKLGDILTFQRGYDLPKTKMIQGEYPVVGSNGIIGYHNEYTTEAPSITIGRSGNTGKPSIFYRRTWSHNTTLYVKDFKGNDPIYVYYFLKFLNLSSYTGGSAVPTLNRNHIHTISVVVPPLSEQKIIANTLSALDDKIENNNKINHHLEQMAQAIFKSWFVDFEPFGGVMPPDWKIKKLGEVCQCVLGGTPNRNKSEYWGGNIPWINSGEINRFRITSPSEYITENGLRHSATKMLPAKTVVLAITGATLGQISILEINSCANQSVVGVVPCEALPYEFIYPFIQKEIQNIISNKTGGAQQHINKQNIENVLIMLPTNQNIKNYHNIVSPIYATISNNCFESARLAELRDTLLPRLMSGELSVSDIKTQRG